MISQILQLDFLQAPEMNYEEEDQNKFQEELKKFIFLLKQEIYNPDIFPFEKQAFSFLNKTVKEREEDLKKFIKSQQEDEKNLKQLILKCEVQKIQYLIKQYLRIRLKKIEKFCFFFYRNQSIAEKKLSQNEYIFMKSYAQLKYKFYEQNILKNLPKAYRGMGGLESSFAKVKDIPLQLDTKQSRVQFAEPQSNQYVFCTIIANPDMYRFNADIPVTNVEQKSVIPINSTIYAQYKYVSKMIAEGNAILI